VIFAFDAFEFNPQALELKHAGAVLKVDPLVLLLLDALVDRAGELVTKQELLTRVWGGRAVSDNVLTVTMARLRKALARVDGETDFVANVFGRGYRFLRPVIPCEHQVEGRATERSAAGSGTPLVGRERVLKAMRSAMSQAMAGRGRAFILLGEPGIGKTRTVEELTREAEATGLRVSWAYCREPGTTPPLWPFAQLVRHTLAKSGLDLQDERVRTPLRELSSLLPEFEGTGVGPTAPEGKGGGRVDLTAKHRLFDAATQLLLMAATSQTSVLVLDDVHQADTATLELLRYLIDEIAQCRILVLATMRSPAAAASGVNLRQLVAHRNCVSELLERLGEQDVAEYVVATVGPHAEGRAHAVFVKSEGNPFFMHELVRQLTQGADELVASSAALEVARQRLAELDESAREALACAAVIGRCFELPLLQAVAGVEMGALMSSLEAAWATDILAAAPDSRTAFVFDHELLRDALYEGLAPAKRRSLHWSTAKALEQRAQAGDAVSTFTLAHHLYAALPECDLRACVHYCAAAAVEAGRSYAYVDGARYFARAREALDLLPDGSPRLRLRLMFGQALYARASSSRDNERLIYGLMRLARAQGNAVTLAHAVLLLDAHPGVPPIVGSRAAVDDALAVLPAAERGLRAALLARCATSGREAFDVERSQAHLSCALELIGDSDEVLTRYVVVSAQLYLRGGPAHRSEADAYMRNVQALLDRNTSRLTVSPVPIELHRAITAQQNGDLLAQNAALARCEQLMRVGGSREQLWYTQRLQALSHINAGDMQRGVATLHELHRRAEQDSLSGAQLLCVYDQIVVLGNAANASYESMRDILAIDPGDSPSIWSIKVRTLAASGACSEAHLALSTHPAAQLARLPCDRDYLGTIGSLAHAAICIGALDYVATLYELLEPYDNLFATHITFMCEGSVAQLRGMLARSLGRTAVAIEHLQTGIRLCERAGLIKCAYEGQRELESLRRA
jgi:DNA-binding winged helix-turn-helix (wHTH) protein